MDSGTIIIGAVVVALCILPFFIFKSGAAKRRKELLEQLARLAQQQNGRISRTDAMGQFAIGLDEQANVVYFIQGEPGREVTQAIQLHDIRSCKPMNISRSVDNAQGNFKVVEKLELALSPKNKHHAEQSLEFYHADSNTQLSGEYQLLEKWANIINSRLSA